MFGPVLGGVVKFPREMVPKVSERSRKEASNQVKGTSEIDKSQAGGDIRSSTRCKGKSASVLWACRVVAFGIGILGI